MPLYEYVCKACGNEHEALQKLSADPLKDCPKCQQPELEKRISAAGFRLKGTGWYETDFKSGAKKNVVGDASPSSSASSSN
jgi:putative FmdB family regulatory protein